MPKAMSRTGKEPAMEMRRIKRKVLLLGDGAVGKTSLIRKFVTDKFDDNYITTIGAKVTKKDLRFDAENADLTMMIWDILGQKGYTAVQSASYNGAEGALLVCDLTRKETLASIEEYWIPELTKVAGTIPLVFVGNKSDLVGQRQISEAELSSFAARHRAPLYLSSAKTGEHVEDLFRRLGGLVLGATALGGQVAPGQKEIVSLVDAADFVIAHFCESYADQEIAMSVVRTQFARAGVDVKAPTRDGLLKAIDYLAEAERSFRDEGTVRANIFKRRGAVEKASG